MQHFTRQGVADAGDGTGGVAVDEAMHHLGIDADHQGHVIVLGGDVFGGVAQVGATAELLETDQVGVCAAQFEEQVGAGGKAVVGAVVDHGRQLRCRGENGREVVFLRDQRGAAAKHAGDDHQPGGANLGRVGGMRHRLAGVHRASADDGRDAGAHQACHAFLALGLGQQRPVAHRAAVHHGAHAGIDQFTAFAHQRVEVRLALGGARGHQGGHGAGEDVVVHASYSWRNSGGSKGGVQMPQANGSCSSISRVLSAVM